MRKEIDEDLMLLGLASAYASVFVSKMPDSELKRLSKHLGIPENLIMPLIYSRLVDLYVSEVKDARKDK